MRPLLPVFLNTFIGVSIHAPARGATRCSCAIVCILCFNPRTRTGCDYLGLYISRSLFVSIHAPARGATRRTELLKTYKYVSIHAPARGATRSNQPGIRVQRFNPRTRTGCDRSSRRILTNQRSFNPRTRTGCDAVVTLTLAIDRRFNPRTRTGCDVDGSPVSNTSGVSIHAPARGATSRYRWKMSSCEVSIHAPARGATPRHGLR